MTYLATLQETSIAIHTLDKKLEELFTDKVLDPDLFLGTYVDIIHQRAALIIDLPKQTKDAHTPESLQTILEDNAYLATTYLRNKSYYSISKMLQYNPGNQLDEMIAEIEEKTV